MNHNCIFSQKEKQVEIFQFNPLDKMPFQCEKVSTITTVDDFDKPVVRNIYECRFDLMSIEVADGDFIVLGSEQVYQDGVMKVLPTIKAHTRESIKANFLAYDEHEGEYLDNILDAFDEIEKEPSLEDILEIYKELEILTLQATTLTIDDLLEEEDEF